MAVSLPFRPAQVVLALLVSTILFVALVQQILYPTYSPRDIRFVPSSYDWAQHPRKHRIYKMDMARPPRGEPASMPPIQYKFRNDRIFAQDSDLGSVALEKKRAEIKRAFKKTWASYKKYAWGRDQLKPMSLGSEDTIGGWAASMIDSLDTLWLMGMKSEFYQALRYVARLDWNHSTSKDYNLFETNIRHLGGLLSAYDLSGEEALLSKATELGDLLYAAFDNPQRMPPRTVNFDDLKKGNVFPDADQSSAGLGSMSLEFTRLSQLTGDPKYYDAIDRITRAFERTQNDTFLVGMWPNRINALDDFHITDETFGLGGQSDSLYEYLVKEHVLLQGGDAKYERMYRQAMDVVERQLLFRPMLPDHDDLLMVGTAESGVRGAVKFSPFIEHLACFAGGMFALGGKILRDDNHVAIGDKLARGCSHAYAAFPHGLMPETTKMQACPGREPCDFWGEWEPLPEGATRTVPMGFRPGERGYLLRPEAIESVFVLYRVTGDDDFRRIAWDMWTAIQKATETKDAFAGVEDVTKNEPENTDSMGSFWLAETLKYFYLIFSDEQVLSLDEWVFNTEAHPLRRVV